MNTRTRKNEKSDIYFYNQDVDEYVLGICLFDPESLEYFKSIGVQGNWFVSIPKKKIWNALIAVADSGDPCDVVNVSILLSEAGELEKVGGASYIASLSGDIATTSNREFIGKKFIEYTKLRRVDSLLPRMQQLAHSAEHEADSILATIEAEVELIRNLRPEKAVTMADMYREIALDLQDPDFEPRRFKTYLQGIDYKFGGFYEEDFTIIAGEKGAGKSTICLNMCNAANQKDGIPIYYFNLEMSNRLLATRNLAAQSKVSANSIRNGKVNREKLFSFAERNMSENFFLMSDSNSIHEIEARVVIMTKKYGVGLVVVDYIQLCEAPGVDAGNRNGEVDYIGRRLKRLAMVSGCHVLGISSLSDSYQGKPTGRNLRDSKSLQFHADNILIIQEEKGEKYIDVDKARNDSKGRIELAFRGDITLFTDPDKRHDPRDYREAR